ncbi:GlsB/YeaQ/YmgE family stress response membrane protein [Aestuariivirga sp.]|uniref:GlsB/YeaQ/YmgE family stress response membrane protein n=1 Tax=Aestuariivirga sp. TaxID=2650926 RepID=UPI0039E3B082
MSLLGTIIIGFIVGLLAKFLVPGKNEPKGFVMTTLLGIVGAFVATFLGQFFGFYRAGENAGFIGAVIGAIIVVYIWAYFNRAKPA